MSRPPLREPIDRSIAPLDWPAAVKARVTERVLRAAWQPYPAGVAEQPTAGVARWLGVRPDQVLLTRGTSDALRLIMRHARAPGWRVAVPEPSWFGYADAADAAGVDVVRYAVGDAHARGPEAWRDLAAAGPVTPIVCTPNNPTSHEWDLDGVLGVVAAVAPAPVIVDLTHDPFVAEPLSRRTAPLLDAGAVVVTSFSKAFGLAGVRLAATLADAATIHALRRRCDRFPLDVLQLAVVAEVGSPEWDAHVARIVAEAVTLRDDIALLLRSAAPHVRVTATTANFVTCATTGDLTCRCCGWLLADTECKHVPRHGVLRVAASRWNRDVVAARA